MKYLQTIILAAVVATLAYYQYTIIQRLPQTEQTTDKAEHATTCAISKEPLKQFDASHIDQPKKCK